MRAIIDAFILIGRNMMTTIRPKIVAIHAPLDMHSNSPTPKMPPTISTLDLRRKMSFPNAATRIRPTPVNAP